MRLPILRKEIRYRAGGLLSLPVLAVAGWWGVYEQARTQDEGIYQSILAQGLAGPIMMICAAVGLACGLWQVLPETRAGSWAFLRHRPVSPTRLLFGKLGAALSIYFLAVGVPLVGVIWWAATPGHFLGPWLWQMAVPPLMDLLGGTVYLLAGMLIALREARWFGSRLLPVGLAVVCSVITWAAPWPWMALVAVALAWLVLLPAACGAIASRGRESRQSWAGRLVTAMTLIPAMAAIPMMAGGLAIELLRPPNAPDQTYYNWHYYTIGGSELYETSYQEGGTKYRHAVDEKGTLLKDTPYGKQVDGNSAWLVSDWDAVGYGASLRQRPYRDVNSYLIQEKRGSSFGRVVKERWCYLRDRRCFAGYLRAAQGQSQLVGYIGANGFAKKLVDALPFAADAQIGSLSGSLDLLAEPGQVLKVDLLQRRCVPVFTAPSAEHVVSAAELQVPLPTADTFRRLLAVATDKATYVLDEQQHVLLRQEHIGAAYPGVSVGANPDLKTFGLLYSRDARHQELSRVFLRVSHDGTALTRTEVPGQQTIWQYPPYKYEWAIMGVVAPPGIAALGVLNNEPQKQWHTSLLESVLPPVICAAISMAIAFWLLRRAGERRAWTIFWLITVLLLGISGVLLMLAMRQWPPRVRCGHCGRKSVTTGFACQHCGTAFPIPDPGAIGIRDDHGACVATV